eukprot:TRINITY_DN3372_c0_g1_i2.p1 TRINITY_DN3372_c0_g1~~TRINITY_DN3372_c0_g1_i2.p1  ORF type:complete len:978 (+),score=264.55 TRINITY_DN3372_c0_g1_i2:555-3488(+)
MGIEEPIQLDTIKVHNTEVGYDDKKEQEQKQKGVEITEVIPRPPGDSHHKEGDGAGEPQIMEVHEKKGPEVFEPELEALLTTEVGKGLTSEEAARRLAQFGFNEIQEVKQNPILKFLSYFNGPIAWLIEAAVILSGVILDWIDFSIILALLVINAVIGFVEEAKAESALDALRQTLALRSKTFRDGALVEVESRELVPGDIIVLRLGDIVPADARLLGLGATGEVAGELHIDQSALTGESLAVVKHKGDVAYSSSIVKQGQQVAVVAKTGEHTFIGRAATLIANTNEMGHFQKVVNQVGNFLIVITLVLCLIMLVVLLVTYHNSAEGLDKTNVLKAISLVLVLCIASIPVGLPTVLSVTMAVGAKQLAAKQVIIKRLPAVEEMAGVSVLCSDKTGTLTLNQLTLVEPFLKPGFSNEDLLFNAYLASEVGATDAIEGAVRRGAIDAIPHLVGNDPNSGNIPGHTITHYKPFDPISKLTEATVFRKSDGVTFKVAKGAPQVIIKLGGGDAASVLAVNENAKRGLRCLGVARTTNAENTTWEIIGMLAFLDPPRPDSASTIAETQKMGVAVKMITGDQLVIAKEVAHRLGMPKTILAAEKLTEKGIPEDELANRALKADGFAQVIPEDKYRVVELLQNKGLLVGMTGDGVNDAPALKKANVGIAVHGCTDAARSAADVVLLSPGLSTIVDGIKTSRAIFQRMRSYAVYRITSTIHFLIFFFLTIITLNFSLRPTLIVMICLLNDAATIVISVDKAQISQKPDKWRMGQLLTLSTILAVLLMASSFAHFFVARDAFGLSSGQVETVLYLQMSSCPHFVIFSTRVPGYFWQSPPSLLFFLVIAATQVFAMFISIYGVLSDPIGWGWGVTVMVISVVWMAIMDVVKVMVYRYWSFELTAKLVPTPARRAKLVLKKEDAARMERYHRNVEKARRVVIMARVVAHWTKLVNEHKASGPSHGSVIAGSSSSNDLITVSHTQSLLSH